MPHKPGWLKKSSGVQLDRAHSMKVVGLRQRQLITYRVGKDSAVAEFDTLAQMSYE